MSFNNVIFGDNQFLGVNHYDQGKAVDLYNRYSSTHEIINTLGDAYNAGIREFMFTTHDKYKPVFKEIINSNLFPELCYSPCLPYAHKYWDQISKYGVAGFIYRTLTSFNKRDLISSVGRLCLLDRRALYKMAMDLELLSSSGLNIKGIFLQNLAFDFLMAMGQHKIIEDFYLTVTERYDAIPGFITMNHSAAISFLCDDIQLNMPWICANYNVSGFRMNPSCTDVSSSFASNRSNNIAMSIMSRGDFSNNEALQHIKRAQNIGNVSSILFGSSSKSNIQSNMDMFIR